MVNTGEGKRVERNPAEKEGRGYEGFTENSLEFLYWSDHEATRGERSEALALTPKAIDLNNKAIIIETLKKRKRGVYRAVPVPKGTIHTLDMVHTIREAQKTKKRKTYRAPLWPWSRTTAFRKVQDIMEDAGIPDGPHKCPKGLRHGYGVHTINSSIPLNMLSKWMGHSSLEVTSIYANALGEEQRSITARMW
jgi:integrase